MPSPRKKTKFLHRPYKPRRRPRTPSASGSDAKPAGGYGSGFLVSRDGHVITNYHVSEAGAKVSVRLGSKVLPATIVKLDRPNDLALLKIKAPTAPLPLGNSSGMLLGAEIHTVGFPDPTRQGQKPKYTRGSISSTHGAMDDERHFQISAPVQPGNSGGPVFDDLGNVVGVVVGKLRQAENVNYAIKSNLVRKLLKQAGVYEGDLPAPLRLGRPLAAEIIPTVAAATVQILVDDIYEP
jgi:serine protease Do